MTINRKPKIYTKSVKGSPKDLESLGMEKCKFVEWVSKEVGYKVNETAVKVTNFHDFYKLDCVLDDKDNN